MFLQRCSSLHQHCKHSLWIPSLVNLALNPHHDLE